MRRVNELVGQGSVSLRERDQTLAALRQAQAGVQQARAQHIIATEQIRTACNVLDKLERIDSEAAANAHIADL